MICGACAGELAAAAIAAAGIVRGKCLGNRCTRQQIGIGGIESGNDVQHRFCRGFHAPRPSRQSCDGGASGRLWIGGGCSDLASLGRRSRGERTERDGKRSDS